MSFRPTINLVMNGELLTDYYCRNYSEWSLLLESLELANECRGLNSPEGIKAKLEVDATESELYELLGYSEYPIFVDMTENIIYHADHILSAAEIKEKPILDLITIVAKKQRAKYPEEESFIGGGIIPFDMLDLHHYLTSGDDEHVRMLLSIIKRNVFTDLYRINMVGLSDEEKKEKTGAIQRVIDDLCADNNKEVLRLKADLCLGAETVFDWVYYDLIDCLNRNIDLKYGIRYPEVFIGKNKDKALIQYINKSLEDVDNNDNVDFAGDEAKYYKFCENRDVIDFAMSVYEAIFRNCLYLFKKYASQFEAVKAESCVARYPMMESVPGMLSYIFYLLGDIYSSGKNAKELNKYQFVCNEDFYHYRHEFLGDEKESFDEFRYVREGYDDELKEELGETDEYKQFKEWEYSFSRSYRGYRTECCHAALGYYTMARRICERYCKENDITKEYLARIDKNIGRVARICETIVCESDPDEE